MDLGDEILARCREQAGREAAGKASEAELEGLRVEALEQLASLPEPPDYRRAHDPDRDRAQARLPAAEALYLRGLKLQRAAAQGPLAPRADALASGLEAQVLAFAAVAQGQIVRGEEAVAKARQLGYAINEVTAAFSRVAEDARPIYDRATAESRYDPREAAHLEVTLPCPNPGCRKPGLYALAVRSPTHRFSCNTCKQPFVGYFGEVRTVEQRKVGRAVHYSLRLEEVGGRERMVEFDDSSGGLLPVAPHDLVALLYGAGNTLAAVENLSTAKVLWVQPKDVCFLATAAYGEGAPELASFRAFRDRVLLPRRLGRLAVRGYYAAGPHLARPVAGSPLARRAVRGALERLRPRIERWSR